MFGFSRSKQEKKNGKLREDRNPQQITKTITQQSLQQSNNGHQSTSTITTRTIEYTQQRSISVSYGGSNASVQSFSSQSSLGKLPIPYHIKSLKTVGSSSLSPSVTFEELNKRWSTQSADSRKPSLDEKPVTASSSSSGTNLNYQSPYRNSPVYRSYQPSRRTQPIALSTSAPAIRVTPPSINLANIDKKPIAPKNKIVVKKSDKFYDQDKPSVPTYSTRSKNRGEVLIINNIRFKDNHERQGAHKDDTSLKEMFKQSGFTVSTHRDLKKTDMEKKVKEFSKKSTLKSVDIAVIVVMSHGTNRETLGGYTEIVGVDDQGCAIDNLLTYFTKENCPNMAEKPKIFIFQCCRGSQEFAQSDAKPIKQTVSVHYEDMLVAYSTLPGFVSHRDPETGTWYIQTLVDVFSEHAHDHHVEDLLKIVDQKVATVSSTRQVTSYENRGFKICYLHPR